MSRSMPLHQIDDGLISLILGTLVVHLRYNYNGRLNIDTAYDQMEQTVGTACPQSERAIMEFAWYLMADLLRLSNGQTGVCDICRGVQSKRKLQPPSLVNENLPRDLLLGPAGGFRIPRLKKPAGVL